MYTNTKPHMHRCRHQPQGMEEDAAVVDMHAAAEQFDPQAESVYRYLQVRSWGQGGHDA